MFVKKGGGGVWVIRAKCAYITTKCGKRFHVNERGDRRSVDIINNSIHIFKWRSIDKVRDPINDWEHEYSLILFIA